MGGYLSLLGSHRKDMERLGVLEGYGRNDSRLMSNWLLVLFPKILDPFTV